MQLRGVIKSSLNTWNRDAVQENSKEIVIKPEDKTTQIDNPCGGLSTTVKIFMSSNETDRLKDAIVTSKIFVC